MHRRAPVLFSGGQDSATCRAWPLGCHEYIETPLMWIDKAATWHLATDLGGEALVDLVREDTHTCYPGDHSTRHARGYGCGACPACELRRQGDETFVETPVP